MVGARTRNGASAGLRWHVRDRAGPRTEWEDEFVEMWGLAWRDRLHNTPSQAAWKALWPEFAAIVCESWCLPDFYASDRSSTDAGPMPPSPKRRRLEVSIAALPPTHGDGDLHSAPRWFSGSGCFLFVVDCEPLAQVVNGQVPLTDPTLSPVLKRIVARFVRWVGAGWHPLTPWGDPVSWNTHRECGRRRLGQQGHGHRRRLEVRVGFPSHPSGPTLQLFVSL